jgi:hypothetical protein
MTVGEIVDTQNTIISMQAHVINELFRLLGQYITAEELDSLPVAQTVNDAAKLKDGIDREM